MSLFLCDCRSSAVNQTTGVKRRCDSTAENRQSQRRNLEIG